MLVGLVGLAACDDNLDIDGARGSCASGGTLSGCDDSEATAAGACWRLVECGIYPVEGDEPGDLDWGRCMDELEAMIPAREDVVVQCVVRATCDELVPVRSSLPACFQFGDT
jgi:hypothetical protein